MKIIGIELRVVTQTNDGYFQHEVAVIPCDVDVELEPGVMCYRAEMNATLHTDSGDIGIQNFQIPIPHARKKPIRHRSR